MSVREGDAGRRGPRVRRHVVGLVVSCAFSLALGACGAAPAPEIDTGAQDQQTSVAREASNASGASVDATPSQSEELPASGLEPAGDAREKDTRTLQDYLESDEGAELAERLAERADASGRAGAYSLSCTCEGNTLVYTVTLDAAYAGRITDETVRQLAESTRAAADNEVAIERLEAVSGVEGLSIAYDFVDAGGTLVGSFAFGA